MRSRLPLLPIHAPPLAADIFKPCREKASHCVGLFVVRVPSYFSRYPPLPPPPPPPVPPSLSLIFSCIYAPISSSYTSFPSQSRFSSEERGGSHSCVDGRCGQDAATKEKGSKPRVTKEREKGKRRIRLALRRERRTAGR